MRILVTGGCGFIGTNFVLYMLKTRPEVSIINLDKLTYAGNRANLLHLEKGPESRRYRFVHGDIADPLLVARIFDEQPIDAVVNFAAESHVDRSITDPAPFVTTNVLGAQNLLWIARNRGVSRFVHISTDEVYGSLEADDPAFTEDLALAPNSPYSASKASADLLVRAFYKTYGFPAVITRCSNNYGPYQFPEKLIPLMYTKAVAGEPLPVYGDGLNIRDWIFVRDHCRGVAMALEKGRAGAIYNFGGAAEKTNLEVIRTLLKALGKPEDLITFVKDRPGHDRRYAMDFSLAKSELGFEPEYDFTRGMAETLQWYDSHRDWLENVKSGEYMKFMNDWYGERN